MMGVLGRREETQRDTQEKPCEDGDGALQAREDRGSPADTTSWDRGWNSLAWSLQEEGTLTIPRLQTSGLQNR